MSKIIWHDLTFPAINLWSLPMSTNSVTGDSLVTKVGNKEQQQKYSDNYDRIFKKDASDWDEKRMDVIGSNGNDGEHYGWQKHDESFNCPVDNNDMIEVETWSPIKVLNKAGNLNWKYVKFYRVIKND